MKDSLHTFSFVVADRWIVNIRGRFAKDAAVLVRASVSVKTDIYHLEGNWNHVCLDLIQNTSTSYTLLWLEDHLCVGGVNYLYRAVREMAAKNVDVMQYSCFNKGAYADRYSRVAKERGVYLSTFRHDRANNKLIQEQCSGSYLISLTSIFKTQFFKFLLTISRPSNWDDTTPFPFELPGNYERILPFIRGISKEEIFCSIDDDNNNTSLQTQRRYPIRLGRVSYSSTKSGLIETKV